MAATWFTRVTSDDGSAGLIVRCPGALPGGCNLQAYVHMVIDPGDDDPASTVADILTDDGWVDRGDHWRCPYCRGLGDALALIEHVTGRSHDPIDDVTGSVLRLEAECVENNGSFPDALREALEAAERTCRTDRGRGLVDTRPMAWEAGHIAALAGADFG